VIVVSDAGPIIHLSLVKSVELLPTLYGRVVIPDLVYREVVEKGEGQAGSIELKKAEWVDLAEHDLRAELFQVLSADLGSGEAAAICLATERKASLIVCDDRQARLAAVRLGFPVIGTLGILLEARRRELVPALAPMLLDLKAKGVWLASSLIEAVLAEAGESIP
jgi:predicted nucleic acid-binding protein